MKVDTGGMVKKWQFILPVLAFMVFVSESYSQCATSPTNLITNGGFETGAALGSASSSTTVYSPITGGCKQVVTDASSGAGCPYMHFQVAAATRNSGTYAFLYDGGSTAGQLVCQVINIDRAKTYDITAYWKS